MLQHTKHQVRFHKMHYFTMFITALCVVFLIKLRWPKDKSIHTHRFRILYERFVTIDRKNTKISAVCDFYKSRGRS